VSMPAACAAHPAAVGESQERLGRELQVEELHAVHFIQRYAVGALIRANSFCGSIVRMCKVCSLPVVWQQSASGVQDCDKNGTASLCSVA